MTPRIPHCLLFATLNCFGAHLLSAQSAQPVTREPTPLGLPRLKSEAAAGRTLRLPVVAGLSAGKYSVDDLSPTGGAGAGRSRRNHTEYLALDPGREWSRPLRGSQGQITFVSFHVCASQNTVVDAGGARLGVFPGHSAGSLRLGYEDSTGGVIKLRSLGVMLKLEAHGGKALASLPMLTIRLDPGAGVWDVYFGSRLLADNLPLLPAARESRRFTLRAGVQGAWISGLVMADENPLYEDANANGIDDTFETKQRGRLLAPGAAVAERKRLAQEWKDYQRGRPPPPLVFNRPLPDRLITTGRL